MEADLSATYQR